MHHKAFGGRALPETAGDLTALPRSHLDLGWAPPRGRKDDREGKEQPNYEKISPPRETQNGEIVTRCDLLVSVKTLNLRFKNYFVVKIQNRHSSKPIDATEAIPSKFLRERENLVFLNINCCYPDMILSLIHI